MLLVLASKTTIFMPGNCVAAGKLVRQSYLPLHRFGRLSAAVSLALVALALPATGWSAGLGRLLVQSGLGQPLRAEVEITALGRDELASLGARLAPPDSFRQAGLELNAALAGVRFAIERRADGRAFVRMTSVQPINEPFIDMLVELNWATGKFVREYTFLLDPPELRAGTEQVEGGSIQESSVVAPAAGARPQTPPDARAPKSEPPAARPTVRAAQRQAASAPAPNAAASGDVQVKSGETLQAIAVRLKPANVQLEQVIVALYQANPSAFFGSIHQLKAGVALSVPDEAAMAAVDARAAAQQIRVQSADFSAYRARLAGAPRAVPGEKPGREAAGTVTARVEDKIDSSAKDQLKLSRSAPAAAATGASALKPAEQGVARDAALREQQGRVTELEKNVSDLQRLLELKNRQLADLQKQVDDARAAGDGAR